MHGVGSASSVNGRHSSRCANCTTGRQARARVVVVVVVVVAVVVVVLRLLLVLVLC